VEYQVSISFAIVSLHSVTDQYCSALNMLFTLCVLSPPFPSISPASLSPWLNLLLPHLVRPRALAVTALTTNRPLPTPLWISILCSLLQPFCVPLFVLSAFTPCCTACFDAPIVPSLQGRSDRLLFVS
jgi:hypothetical protein